MQISKSIFAFTALAIVCATLTACGKKDAQEREPTPAPLADMPEPVAAMPEPSGKPLKITIGIAACDEFLAKYRSCFDKLPSEMQNKMKNGLEKTEQAWLTEAKDPEAHDDIRSSCESLNEATAPAMKAQGCVWD